MDRLDLMTRRPGSPRSTLIECEYEDGVILTGNTRSEKMTRRRSMSNLFGASNRQSSSGSGSSPNTTMNRRGSLRGAIQNQTRNFSEDSLRGMDSVKGVSRLPQTRRASMGSPLTSSPSILGPSRPRLPSSRGSSRGLLSRTSSFRKQDSLRGRKSNGNLLMKSNSQRSIDVPTRPRRGSSQRSMNTSGHESIRGDPHRLLQKQGSLADLMVDCNTTVSVSNTWASVRHVTNYQRRFGEQIILKLVEMQPQTARANMRLESFFSDRFDHVCKVLIGVVDMIVTLLGPDLEESGLELAQMGQRCRDEGINTDHLGEAVSIAVETLLGDDAEPDMVKAWKTTFNALKRRLSVKVEA